MSSTAALSLPKDFTLPIDGMTCASCVLRVEKALTSLPGVQSVAVNLATEQATVRATAEVAAGALAAAVRKAGYDVPKRRVELQVEGMTCASCVARVEKALLKVPGVSAASVNLATRRPASKRSAPCRSPRLLQRLTRPATRPGRWKTPRRLRPPAASPSGGRWPWPRC